MEKIIIGDNQTIFRAGMTKLLSVDDGNHIVAQCPDCPRLYSAVETFRDAIIIVSSTLKPDFLRIQGKTGAARSRVIVIAENFEPHYQYTSQGASGVVFRGDASAALVDCVRRVAAGDREVPSTGAAQRDPEPEDVVGSNVLARLTPKELKILALILQGMKNKGIGIRLNTTEQVIKNYLRVVFDKTGVSGRLELALFTIYHRVLAAAAAEASAELERSVA
jgi:DNA-binding NarL/FixJ family response regulator